MSPNIYLTFTSQTEHPAQSSEFQKLLTQLTTPMQLRD
jgi:hypothetical protein